MADDFTTDGTFAATTASQSLIEKHFDEKTPREEFSIANNGTANEIVYVSFGNVAVAGQGIPLRNGQVLIQSAAQGYKVFQGRVNIIASANVNVGFYYR